MDCYGFLAKAQIEHSVFVGTVIKTLEAQVNAKRDVQAGVVADFDKRIAQIVRAVRWRRSGGAPMARWCLRRIRSAAGLSLFARASIRRK
jgi:hypothetical protein